MFVLDSLTTRPLSRVERERKVSSRLHRGSGANVTQDATHTKKQVQVQIWFHFVCQMVMLWNHFQGEVGAWRRDASMGLQDEARGHANRYQAK